ncbi:MAG: hypothetical protein M3375_01535 [Actinomycetota bacterium]|nr:hypothetical protein [Actinomycetota bacterium]
MITLVIVVAVVGIAAVLLARTVQEAQTINDKAQNIAKNGRGINSATDSVIQLRRTNRLARSILGSASPLDSQLGGIVATAQGIDGLAGSILSSAGSINTTARSINTSAGTINQSADAINSAAGSINTSASSIGTSAGRVNTSASRINTSAGSINASAGRIRSSAGAINRTARRIDSTAGSILRTARLVDTDVRLINQNLDVTLGLVTAIKGDTGNILNQARGANDTAACIDRKLFGPAGDDGDCQGQATPAARERVAATRPAPRLEDIEKLRQGATRAASGARSPTPPPPPPPPPPPTQRRQAVPLQERLPKLPTQQLDDILDGLLPGLGAGQGLPDGKRLDDLIDQLLSNPSPRADDLLDRLLSAPVQR